MWCFPNPRTDDKTTTLHIDCAQIGDTCHRPRVTHQTEIFFCDITDIDVRILSLILYSILILKQAN